MRADATKGPPREGPRIGLVPRLSADGDDDWYPWLRRALRPQAPITIALRPHPGAPAIEACVASLSAALGRDPSALGRTVLVAHSVGCLAALHFLASLPHGCRLSALVAVAGWWTLDRPRAELRPWIDRPPDVARAKGSLGRCIVLLGHDDPHLRDQVDNARLWRERLGAEVVAVAGAGHFGSSHQPAVLSAVLSALGGGS